MDLVRPPDNLAAALARSTVTVLAEVADVQVGRTIHDLHLVNVSLNVKDVVSGTLQPGSSGTVDVEFTGTFDPEPPEAMVRELRNSLPVGVSLWVLRWHGAPPETVKPGAPQSYPAHDPSLYRLVHPMSGIVVEVSPSVVQVVSAGKAEANVQPSQVQRELESFSSLTALREHIAAS